MIRAVIVALGLVTGSVQVEVEVASPPHSIELLLDGAHVAELTAPPWQARIDLGDELVPRELVAVSRDESGRELDRHRRWLNLRLPAEAERHDKTPVAVVLDQDRQPDGLASWFEADGRPVEVLEITEPGVELWVVRDPQAQPEIERAASLALGAELEWGHQIDADTLRAGPEATLEKLSQNAQFVAHYKHRFAAGWRRWLEQFGFGAGSELRFVSPWGAPVSQIETARQIFSTTPPVAADPHGLLYHVYATRTQSRWYRLADAVGVAGVEATARGMRRAVLVLTSDPERDDDSLYHPQQVRRLLAELGVPLFVWSFAPDDDVDVTASGWGRVTLAAPSRSPAGAMEGAPGFGMLRDFEAAFSVVAETLRRQRIAWIRGSHLPGNVTLSQAAHGVRLAGQDPESEP